jgi:hypothetical protein
MSNLLMTILVPATIINSISTAVIEPQLLLFPVAGMTVVLTLLGIGFLLVPLLGLRGGTRGAFLLSFPTNEYCQRETTHARLGLRPHPSEKKTGKREAIHIRQRLQTLRFYSADDFPRDDDKQQ